MSGVSVRVCGSSDTGLVRSGNEDAFLIADLAAVERLTEAHPAEWPVGDRGLILAVSDGMGGAKAGEVASAICIDGLYRGLAEGGAEGGSEDADELNRLRSVVERVSREVREAAARSDRRGMGATLTAVLLRGGMAYIAEVGDSRAYLLRGKRICQVTRDQSYVQMLVDAGAITPEVAEHSPQKNLIMQVMGQREALVVALQRLELMDGDRLLLCSDGLSNMVSDAQISEIARAPADVSDACSALVAAANSAGGEDNITVVLAEVIGPELRARQAGEGRDSQNAPVIETVQDFKL